MQCEDNKGMKKVAALHGESPSFSKKQKENSSHSKLYKVASRAKVQRIFLVICKTKAHYLL